MSEFTIELRNLNFFSFHGLYKEEKIVGGEFIADVFVKYPAAESGISSIEQTINYASLYEIIKEEMSQPRDLLETVAQSISTKIQQRYPAANSIEVRIEKKNPPIAGFSGSVAVRFKK